MKNTNWNKKADYFPYCLEECKAINEKVLYTLDSIFSNSDFWHIKERQIHFDGKMNSVLIPVFTKEIKNMLGENFSLIQNESLIHVLVSLRKDGNRKELKDWFPFPSANGGGGSKTTAIGFELEIESNVGNKEVLTVVENWQSDNYRLSQKAAKKEMNALDFNSKLPCNDSLYVEVVLVFDCIDDCFSPKEKQYMTRLGDFFRNGNHLFDNQEWNVEKVKNGLIENNLISDSLIMGVFLVTEIDKGYQNQKVISIFEFKPIPEGFLHNWETCKRSNLYAFDSRFQIQKEVYKELRKENRENFCRFSFRDSLNNRAVTAKINFSN